MTPVWVVVPYRGDDGGHRDKAWQFMQAWWAREHPSYTVVEGTCRPGPWCKADAVADALRHTFGGILVVVDADVLCEDIPTAVEAVATGAAGWAVPHLRVNRLTPDATTAVLAGGPLPSTPPLRRHLPTHPARGFSAEVAHSYPGLVGGGLVVLPRALYERVPLDPRFLGYGQEDTSWGLALRVMAGEPYRGRAPLYHLWHPPQDRPTSTQAGLGSADNRDLHYRYQRALTPEAMTALLEEIPR